MSLPGFSPPPDLEAARMLRAAGLALPLLARDTSSCKRLYGEAEFLGMRASAGGEALRDTGSAQVSLQLLLSPPWLFFSQQILESPKRHKTHHLSPSIDLLVCKKPTVFGRQRIKSDKRVF